MMHIEPCPFCGIDTRLREYPFCDIIECENENCHVKPSISMSHYNEDHRNTYLLVEAWNMRYERTCEIVKDVFDWKCSVCGKVITEQVNYCPSCGARVIEDE